MIAFLERERERERERENTAMTMKVVINHVNAWDGLQLHHMFIA